MDRRKELSLKDYDDSYFEFVYNLKRECYRGYVQKYFGEWNEQEQQSRFKSSMESSKGYTKIIIFKGEPIGFFCGRRIDRGFEIENICILPKFQNKGLGTAVLKRVIGQNRSRDIFLKVFKGNPAQRLYERLGFEQYEQNESHIFLKRYGKIAKFKSSRSESDGLKLIDKSFTDILSVGISTGGSAELEMARLAPRAKIIATTLDRAGLEFTDKILNALAERDRIETKIEDVTQKMPYRDETFDFVYARLVLHYLDRQGLSNALDEIFRVLKKGGLFYAVIRNRDEWELKVPNAIIDYDGASNITTYFDQQHKVCKRQFLSEQEMRELLMQHGFKVVSGKSIKEYIYIDYQRTMRSKRPNSLSEVVAKK